MKIRRATRAALLAILTVSGGTAMGSPAKIDLSVCRRVEVPPGPEDIELDRWSTPPRLIVGSSPPVAVPIVHGMLGDPVPLSVDPKVHLDAIGISLVRRDERTMLYAVNRNVGVEVFELDGLALVSRATLRSHHITNPNGIAATRSGDVYVSNMFARGGVRGQLSALFRTRSGSVVRHHGGVWSVAVSPVRFANGLLLSPDESQLWVAAFADRRIDRYARDAATGALTHEATVRLQACPDNLKWSTFPRLVAAVHPSYARTGLHVMFPRWFDSPTQVAVIDDATVDTPQAEIVLEDAGGGVISAASSAIVHGGRVFLSQVKRGYLIDCPAPRP